MKTLTVSLVLIFSVLFSSTSYADWVKVGKNSYGTFYVDFERIRKHDGYVYYWQLSDYLKPSPYGDLSAKTYKQGDCELFRLKHLSWSFHKAPMGDGTGHINNEPDKEWNYPSPDSSNEYILKFVCEYAK